jgi:hypothetical protein
MTKGLEIEILIPGRKRSPSQSSGLGDSHILYEPFPSTKSFMF